MLKDSSRSLQKYVARPGVKRLTIIGVAAVFALVGLVLLIQSTAATLIVAMQAESGNVTGLASKDEALKTGASQQGAVKFGVTSGSPSPSPGPGGESLLMAAAGDIAQDGGEQATSDIIVADKGIKLVLTLGDNAYESGTIDEYNSKYAPTWGRFKSMTKPTPGNHEYLDDNKGYNAYWNNPPEYYSFDQGGWHFISLNSQIEHSSSSTQLTWLKQDLAAHPAQCTLAYWHQPRFTAGSHDDDSTTQPFWDALYAANADVVLNGHSHTYERFALSKPDGTADTARGIREFVVGTGGATLGGGGHSVAKREFSDESDLGVIKMTLTSAGYSWKFVTEGGSTKDQGTGTCH